MPTDSIFVRSQRWFGGVRADTWVVEIFTVSLSLCCLAAVIILLFLRDNVPIKVDDTITLNTLVSILSNAIQASAALSITACIGQWCWCEYQARRRLPDFEVFMSASRGPVGCIQLLFCTGWGSLVWIGAAAVIGMIFFGPFMQQLIQYRQATTAWALAEIPKAERYSRGQEIPQTVAKVLADADFLMQAAVLNGLVNPPDTIRQQLDYRCLGSDCNWPNPYDSLAVCSRCQDLTEQLESTPESPESGTMAANLSMAVARMCESPVSGTKFSLENGQFLDGKNGWTYSSQSRSSVSDKGVGCAVALLTSYGTANASQTNSLRDIDTLIWSMSIIRVKPDIPSTKVLRWPDIPVEAVECGLYYCVNEYTSQVVNSTLHETVKEKTQVRRNPASWRPLTPTEQMFGITLNSSIMDDIAIDPFSSIARSDLMLGKKYNISQASVLSVSAFMTQIFAARTTNPDIPLANGWVINVTTPQYSPPVSEILRLAPNLTDIFHGLAISMSNAIRATSDNSLTEPGREVRKETVYHIEWKWIALPAFVVLATLIQLILSIHRSRSTHTPIWKTSTLATMPRDRSSVRSSTALQS